MSNKFKGVKVTFLGEPLHMVYPHATAWQLFKYRVYRGIRWVGIRSMVVAGVTGIIFTTYKIGQSNPDLSFTKEISAVAITPAYAGVTAEAKISSSKDELVESLGKQCETKGSVEPDAIIILDTNNKMSIGSFQFQITTVQHYMKVLHQKEISRVEAIQIAIDHKKAAALAKEILFEVKGGYGNWATCAAKLDLPVQIALLNKLDK